MEASYESLPTAVGLGSFRKYLSVTDTFCTFSSIPAVRDIVRIDPSKDPRPPSSEKENIMNKTLVSLLLLSAAVCVTPASANYFSNVRLGVNLNIGSAPNPKPASRPFIVEAPYITVHKCLRAGRSALVVSPAPSRRRSWPRLRPLRRRPYAGLSSSSISTSRT